MSRLCIQITPNNHPTDPSRDPFRVQAGEIVCIEEDGHEWSKGELACGQYKFIDVSGVAQADMIRLIAAKLDADGNKIGIRRLSLNLAELKSNGWKNRTTATKNQIDSITIEKT